MTGPGGRNLIFVGDVHLGRADPAVGVFCDFLDGAARTAWRIVLAGDLFDVWIGRPDMEGPHHRAVVSALRQLRERGISVRYLEGNRDYGVARAHVGSAFDDASENGVEERFGGRSIFAAHGHRVVTGDARYRLWWLVSRTRLAWVLFHQLPVSTRFRLVTFVERHMAHSNRTYAESFPEADVRRFAARKFLSGRDTVVLGHFHVEKDLGAEPPSPPGRILVLPQWKESHRHLRVTAEGEIGFVDSLG